MIKGVILTIIIAIVAYLLSAFIPIGSVAISIILGIILANSFKISSSFNSGITYSEKSILAFAIALMGIKLDFTVLEQLGYQTIILIIVGVVVTILSAMIFAKLLKFDTKFALILGIGNAVCGSSAIAATKGVIKAKGDEVGISVAVVNLLGTIGIFLVPFIATYILKLQDTNSGILIGNTLQAVGQVVAGGFSISDTAGQSATIVKMGRVLMLTPLIVVLLLIFHDSNNMEKRTVGSILKNVPLFIVGFVGFSIIATLKILPSNIIDMMGNISEYALIVAMAGVGLKITFSSIKESGQKALFLGILIWIVQIVFTSLVILYKG